ncbi:MAG: hypothetical protein PHG96_11515 [Kiritimatiellae bacterium]|nr:hypothetical protein [Kiritimatiellia bacterium]
MKRYLTPVITAVLVALMVAIPASSNIFWDIIGGNLHFKSSGRKSSVYFGVNDDGMDVTMYGATTGKYFMWDESADKAIISGTLDLNGTNITATGAEINYNADVTPGTVTANKALVLGSDRGANYFTVSDSLQGEGTALSEGFLRGVQLNGADGNTITLTAAMSGKLVVVRGASAKVTCNLPTGVAGLEYPFFVQDADSIVVVANAVADSLYFTDGNVYKTTTTVAGTIIATCIETGKWVMRAATGTWTSY